MLQHSLIGTLISALIVLAAPLTTCAADVLDNVPADALGFVVVKNLAATNTKAERLLQALQLQFPGPLAFLKLATGVGEGLDTDGDMLLTVLPGTQPTDRPQLGIWLPVSNYEQFVTSLDGTAAAGTTAVTVAGEDLLVAQHGEWALIMDPDQRERLEKTLAGPTAPPPKMSSWHDWIHEQDISVTILPGGLRAAWTWAAADRPDEIAAIAASEEGAPGVPADPPAAGVDDFFGPAEGREAPVAADFWSLLRQQVRKELNSAPQITRWAAEAEAVACGTRVDADGNIVAGLRVAWQRDWPMPINGETHADVPVDPPALLPPGEYMVSGSGKFPGSLIIAATGAYARFGAEYLKNDIQVQMEDGAITRFQNAVERAAAEVTAVSVLTLPGDKQDGIYSNEFLAARVRAADDFVDRVADIVRSWNEMNKSEQDESRLVFEVKTVQIAGRTATQYSLDMVQAFGAAAVPEVRPSMERLFGPGGKFRLLVVPIDEHTVLVAAASPEQAAPIVDGLAQAQPIRWDERTNRLLPREAAWRLMASPRGRTRWLKRQMDAMLGPVIGGPIVRQFPPSPPIGAVGGFSQHEFWTDAAIPAETVRAAGQFLHER